MANKFKKKAAECFHMAIDRTAIEERKMANGALVPWFVCTDCGTKFYMQRNVEISDPKVKKES